MVRFTNHCGGFRHRLAVSCDRVFPPGGVSTLIDLSPTKPGWVIESVYSHYSGDASAGRSFPLAGLVTARLEVEIDAAALGLLYTFDETLLGAHYTLGAFVPYVSADVSGFVSTSEEPSARDAREMYAAAAVNESVVPPQIDAGREIASCQRIFSETNHIRWSTIPSCAPTAMSTASPSPALANSAATASCLSVER